ncbi:hypothetical protein SAMN05421874_13926 [Nonomuraea maritima]|uniref:ARB-07466-like C-terminal domain-containing protein n=1 Tax=Nonomuraea maritima TaxID=683260 RepID=A0A1G9QJF4_9ACTN|nr:hypothetical protein [Nonomuraea maritima]SDM11158.1 hypothetical protein SAMN05421874_13926 [Nonomuraea maritima]
MAASSPASFALGLITAAALVALPATPAAAAPKPTEAQLRAELKRLNSKVDKLIETYNLQRVALAEAKDAAVKAKERLATAEQKLALAEDRVGEIARLRYQNGDPSVFGMVLPTSASKAALIQQLAAEQQAVVLNVAKARDDRKQASEDASALVKEIGEDTVEVAEQRDEAKKVIADIRKKLADLVPYATGRNSDGSWAPELPSGSDNVTPRTRLMRAQLEKNFALPFTVGCFRSGSSGEHPLGRACDFMMSAGGSLPTGAHNALGDRIAAWALQNKDKLGVKYVIWKQRINMGSGWRAMEDRGSITENHYDHVHISMY